MTDRPLDRILGIETSCDETAAAVVEETGDTVRPWRLRSSVVARAYRKPSKVPGTKPSDHAPLLVDVDAQRDMLPAALAEVSERDLVAHFTRLSHRQFSVDLGAYPLGSCTMKYNPKINEDTARLPGFAALHPYQSEGTAQGALQLMWELQQDLQEITGMDAVSLQRAAGAQGELPGILMIRSSHRLRGDAARTQVIVPDSAHGTNPASVSLGGYEVTTVPSDSSDANRSPSGRPATTSRSIRISAPNFSAWSLARAASSAPDTPPGKPR